MLNPKMLEIGRNTTFWNTLGWEFIKEKTKVRKQENTHSLKKKRTCSRKHALDQEGDQEKKRTRPK